MEKGCQSDGSVLRLVNDGADSTAGVTFGNGTGEFFAGELEEVGG